MKHMIRLYRILKPVVIYTSYLFTVLTVLYLTVHMVYLRSLILNAAVLWGILFFSLGSILLQRVFLGSGFLAKIPYGFRLFLYLCAVGIWGYGCLYFSQMLGILLYQMRTDRVFLLVLLAGICCCAGFELFNRCRAHMYNALLEQYKKRKQS